MINRILNRLGYTLFNNSFHTSKYRLKEDFSPLHQLFHKFLHPDFFFLQIGANDGISNDPIFSLVTKEKVRGIALEPLPDLFEELTANYREFPQVRLLNLAIHSDNEQMFLFRVDPNLEKYPDWVRGIASFHKDHHQLSGVADEDMIKVQVKCISMDRLISEYGIDHIDLLQIDTEGYDSEIIQMIDFNRIKPRIISFEHGVGDGIMSRAVFNDCIDLLMKQGYQIVILNRDAVAYID